MYSLTVSVTLRGVTYTPPEEGAFRPMADVPYIAGPSSAAPAGPTRPAHIPAQTRPATTQAPHEPVLAGERVDLAHELKQLRKLQYTTFTLLCVVAILALIAAVSSAFVAYVTWSFLDALHKAFG